MIDIIEEEKFKPIIEDKIVIRSFQHLNDILQHCLNVIANKNKAFNNVNEDYLEANFFSENNQYIILVKRNKDLIAIERKNLLIGDILLFSLYDIKRILERKYIF